MSWNWHDRKCKIYRSQTRAKHERRIPSRAIKGFDAEACWPLNGPLFSPLNPLYSHCILFFVEGVTGPPLSTNWSGRVLQAISSVMEYVSPWREETAYWYKNIYINIPSKNGDSLSQPSGASMCSGKVRVFTICWFETISRVWIIGMVYGCASAVLTLCLVLVVFILVSFFVVFSLWSRLV